MRNLIEIGTRKASQNPLRVHLVAFVQEIVISPPAEP